MNKAFTREPESQDDDDGEAMPGASLPAGTRNYITPQGYGRLRAELLDLIDNERPRVVEVVHWAASNGDRSENGDYLYGKKRLREIDRRIRFLTKRLEIAEVTDPSVHHGGDQVFFGASVRYASEDGSEREITILGIDEADITHVDMDDDRAQDAADLRFLIAVRDRPHLDSVMRAIKRTPSVLRVQRVRPRAARTGPATDPED